MMEETPWMPYDFYQREATYWAEFPEGELLADIAEINRAGCQGKMEIVFIEILSIPV